MKRYCAKCEKEFEFDPVLVAGKDSLYCPECGSVIDKNSRKPVEHTDSIRLERAIGTFYSNVLRLAYIFYIVLAVIGFIAYFLSFDKVLYVTTAIAIVAFILQLVTGTLRFKSGVVLLPAGAEAGFFLLGEPRGICVGILAVFFLRHLIRDMLFRLGAWLIHLGNK